MRSSTEKTLVLLLVLVLTAFAALAPTVTLAEEGEKEQDKKQEAKKEDAEQDAPDKDLPRQVRITARILEWTHDSTLDWGFSVRYTNQNDENNNLIRLADLFVPSQSQQLEQGLSLFFKGISSNGEGAFDIVIQALEQVGDVKVLCEPNIVVTCPPKGKADKAQPAKVSTKSKVPYEAVQPAGTTLVQITKFRDTATQLTVTVREILKGDFVKMNIDTSVTDLSGYISVGTGRDGQPLMVPRTETRKITNTVLAGDRQVFIIGVLKTTKDYKHSQGVPWLARIPILGYFFKNMQIRKKDQELLFIVRPEIVRN